MEDTRTSVEDFIRHFERNNNKSDFSDAVSQFADVFMAAGPQGAQCVKASDFALALPKRKQLFASFGCDGDEPGECRCAFAGRPLRDGAHAMEDEFHRGRAIDSCDLRRFDFCDWTQPREGFGWCFTSPIRM